MINSHDIVVDTNVFLHCNNEMVDYCESSRTLLSFISDSETKLCIDDVFDIDEAKNTSRIGSEYFNHIRTGTMGYAILLKLLGKGVNQIQKKKYLGVKKKLCKFIKNKSDIVFVLTAIGSQSNILISNDFEDFQQDKRESIKKHYGVKVMCSLSACSE